MRRILFILTLLMISVSCRAGAPKRFCVQTVREFPHDRGAYTQGLFFYGDTLMETTGTYGESSVRVLDLESGRVVRKLNFSRKYFAEGSVVLNGKMYILTWTNKVAFVYDAATLDYRQTYSYPREGWGLTTDGKSLIASDGTSRLYFLSPEFKLEKTLGVTLNGRPVKLLNELEWIDGKIWANVYTTDLIVIIDPVTGQVEATVDCAGLLPDRLRTRDTDVLNGIAVDSSGRIFLTGKNWPRLYEVKLVDATKKK